MEKLTALEFQSLCDRSGFVKFTYESRRQESDSPLSCSRTRSVYRTMLVFLGPTALCFQGGEHTFCLEPVKYVRIELTTASAMTFTVVCGAVGTDLLDQRFRFRAFKK